ncbi:glycosyltransferase family 4 protein [Candidatus Pacearchaeota archaeon]|nr:glycosyltransferase family 4 protein [Candidatus Pacearchaeota archaeon]
MKYIDASRYNNTKNRTGVENYSYFLINELIRNHKSEIALISPRKIDQSVRQIIIPFPRLWTQLRLSWEIWRNKRIDNLFIPSHVMPLIHPKNTTITIHDVAFKRFPNSYGWLSRTYLDFGAKFAVKRAQKIIVPSEATKQDLIKFYQANPDKITVIPLGFEAPDIELTTEDIAKTLNEYHLKPRHYFLFVGRIETKKNLRILIEAFKEVHKNNPYMKLVLAGKPGVGFAEILRGTEGDNIILTDYIGEKEKWALMANCLAFTFPSLFEGFGLPLLEAMAAGVPIVASEIPTSYEIAKNNALFFKTDDAQALFHHLKMLVEQTGWWDKLIQNHEWTLGKYTWEKCAEKTWETLEKS